MNDDRVMNFILHAGFTNNPSEKLKIIFVPCYLDRQDGILNVSYYDLLIGMDATVFPSYYEPWGYTPLESIAFGIPTITTDLAGFGLWAQNKHRGESVCSPFLECVSIVHRTDGNYHEVVSSIVNSLLELINKDKSEIEMIRNKCFELASHVEWEDFIEHYFVAYHAAFFNAAQRNGI